MESKLSISVWGLGMAALALLAGCSADPDLVDGKAEEVPAIAVGGEGDGTFCKLPSAEGARIEWEASQESGRVVRVSNPRDVSGVVELTRTLVTTRGTESAELGRISLAPGQSAVIPLPASDDAVDGEPTSLHVTGRVEYADGERAGTTLARSFAPAAKAAATLQGADLTPGDVGGPAGIIIPSGPQKTQLCFEYPGTFPDTFGDRFKEGVPTYRDARGLRVNIWGPESFVLRVYLDKYGCTPIQTFQMGSNRVRVYTGGEIDGANFDVVDAAQDGLVQQFEFKVLVMASSSAQTYRFDPSTSPAADAFNVAQAAGHVFRENRVVSGYPPDLTIVANAATDKSHYAYWANTINLEPGDHDEKGTIAHEIGHFIMDVFTGFPDKSGCGGSHDALAYRNQVCAMQEGFANWWGAQAYNSVLGGDCRYGSVDCADGMATGGSCTSKSILPLKVMETCHESEDWTGSGVETDWMRMFWNLRAPNTGITLREILDWIDTANEGTAWTSANVYQLLNARANVIGGKLNTLFDTQKARHGIDHNP